MFSLSFYTEETFILPPLNLSRLFCYRYLGCAYAKLFIGDRETNLRHAISFFTNALQIYTETAFPQEYAASQLNLGIAYFKTRQGNRTDNLYGAIACYKNALRIYTRTAFPQDYALTQLNLGNAYVDLQDGERDANLHRAIACNENALEVFTETAFPERFSGIQNNLGIVYKNLANGEPEENLRRAIACYEKSLRICSWTAFPYKRVDVLQNLAIAYENKSLQEVQEAYTSYKEAIRGLETHIRAVASASTRRSVAEEHASVYASMVSLCKRLGKAEETFSYAERGKSRTLVEMLHTAQLEPSEIVPEELRTAFKQVRGKLDEFEYLQQAGQQESARNFKIEYDINHGSRFRLVEVDERTPREEIYRQRDEVQQAYQTLLAQIREKDEVFAATEQVMPLALEEVKAVIPPNTVLVECFAGGDGTYLFVIDGTGKLDYTSFVLKELTTTEIANTLSLKHWITPYYAYGENPTPETFQAWQDALTTTPTRLADTFWYAQDEQGTSLAALIEQSDAERIVFIPHYGLHLLPFHLIPLRSSSDAVSDNGNSMRLIDRYEIAYAPSATLLRFALQRERSELSSLFAVANPDRSLTFTDGEVQGIALHFEQQQILLHDQASKAAVYEQAKDANLVHFSCHGNFRSGDPMESRLLLAGDKDDDKKDLTLRDIFANLKLPNAAAVILSACETGMVELERGDEYIGLPSGFLYAGAPTVISSLWAVDDLSTSLLMNRLYENMISKKIGKAAALRDAQLWIRDLTYQELVEYLEQASLGQHIDYTILRGLQRRAKHNPDQNPFEHPYYWGAFTCNGSWT